MNVTIAALLLLAAQQRPDTVLMRASLGGDSARTREVRLEQDYHYRLEVRPANATVAVRQRVTGAPIQVLALNPLGRRDSVPGGAGHIISPTSTGLYTVELEPSSPAATVTLRVSQLPGDVAANIGRSELIFAEMLSSGPGATSIIYLDTGVVYRFVADDIVVISPRMASGAPVRLAPLVRGGGHGTPFVANQPGDYVLTAGSGSPMVRVYRDQADAAELRCIRDPQTPGCVGSGSRPDSRGRSLARLLMFLTPVVVFGFLR